MCILDFLPLFAPWLLRVINIRYIPDKHAKCRQQGDQAENCIELFV